MAALTDIPEPRVAKTPSGTSAAVPAEVREAILSAFPYEGSLRVRHLWSEDGVTCCRANWYRQVDGETTITRSLFVQLTQTSDGLVAQDKTAVG